MREAQIQVLPLELGLAQTWPWEVNYWIEDLSASVSLAPAFQYLTIFFFF